MVVKSTQHLGRWQVLSYNTPILAIHAALLHTSPDGRPKVLIFAGSGYNPRNINCRDCSAVWDYERGTFYRPVTPVDEGGVPIDIFCPGHAFLPDGRLLVAGGTEQYDPFVAERAALVFDPATLQWTSVPSMANGRFYPTLLTLVDGRVFVMSGLDQNANLNTIPEIYTDGIGWAAFPANSPFGQYPGLFLMQDGRIFFSGAQFSVSPELTAFGGQVAPLVSPSILTLPASPTQPIQEQPVPGLPASDTYRDQSTSILLPPAQDQRVMLIGGGNALGSTTDRVIIVDLKSNSPTYRPAASLNYARMHVCAVLLPDRTVLACNGTPTIGHTIHEDATTQARLPVERYDPVTNTWTVLATPSVPRTYHNVALLLPDGRVLTAGGNPARGVEELRIEIYSPPYLFMGERPVIQAAPRRATYGETIQIQTPQARNIKWASLIKPNAITHSWDSDHRLVDLPIISVTSTALNVTVTSNPNLAVPGWYMLFITDNNGVPSVANWIQLALAPSA